MELLKDYDVTIQYPGKANVVADALSRKAVSMGSLSFLRVSRRPLAREFQTLASLIMQFGVSDRGGILASVEVKSTYVEQIKAKQFEDKKLNALRNNGVTGEGMDVILNAGWVLWVR